MLRTIIPLAVLGFVLTPAGCGKSESSAPENSEHTRIRAMSSLYAAYLAKNKNQTPPNEQAFRTYLGTKQEELQKVGLTVDDVFASPRTGAPLQWVYGKKPVTGRGGMRYVGYEQTPTDNKRLVIANAGMYEVMDDTDFRRFFPNAQ